MKTLYLVRHAHAENKNTRTDFLRELDAEGKSEALKIANLFISKNIQPQLIVSSNAERTLQTSNIIAEKIQYPSGQIIADARLYTADEAQYLVILKEMNNSVDSLMITGHNPSISEFAHALTGQFSENMATSSCVKIQFNTDDWSGISWRSGKLIEYIEPAAL